MEKLMLKKVIVVQITLSSPNIDQSCLHISISTLLCCTGHLPAPELVLTSLSSTMELSKLCYN